MTKLKKVRLSREYSVPLLARKAGLHESLLYRIEQGERRCTWDTALKVAEVLKCDPRAVFQGRDEYARRKR
jgi:DNA-binding XRE family transcriptional regulator